MWFLSSVPCFGFTMPLSNLELSFSSPLTPSVVSWRPFTLLSILLMHQSNPGYIYIVYPPFFPLALKVMNENDELQMFTLRMLLLVDGVVFFSILLLIQFLTKGSNRVEFLGWICVVFATSVFAAPLSIMVRTLIPYSLHIPTPTPMLIHIQYRCDSHLLNKTLLLGLK